MSFQRTAVSAVAFGRSAPPRFARLAGTLAGGILAGTVFAAAGAAFAGSADAIPPGEGLAGGRTADWTLCRRAATEVESRISAPNQLLSAVTLTETGRRGPEGKALRAWPWTINVGGKGYVFTSKNEAVRAVRRLLAEGHRSIDVGCMQVNLKYHPRAFTSLEEAFDPAANLAYGADFLTRLKARHGSWNLAVQHYHSYTEEHRQAYAARFNTLWARERARVARAAREARSSPAGLILASLPDSVGTLIPSALPDIRPLRRLNSMASLLAFGVNLNALERTAQDGNAFLERLTGRYPAIADTRTRSASLTGTVPVN